MDSASESSTIALLKSRFESIGYTIMPLILDERHYSCFRSPAGALWLTSDVRINYPFVASTARSISSEKSLAYALAALLGMTIPLTSKVHASELPLIELATYLKAAPLIVKPSNASLSHGLTMNIKTAVELQSALKKASRFADTLLIQQQIQGDEIRFVALGGKIDAALLRQTPRVVGDGISTMRTLINDENNARATLHTPYLTYPQLAGPLIDLSNINMARVPASEEIIELGSSTMIAGGASVYDITDQVHPSYMEAAQKLAAGLGSGLIVVDIIIKDYRQPLEANNYAFIEFNMSPVVKLFYSCRDGNQYDILKQLVPMIDTAIHDNVEGPKL
jgi:D-alanine-D-alanine ligase-like ATP-grasp enzyme